jgi:outer membrane cobalamin receptor
MVRTMRHRRRLCYGVTFLSLFSVGSRADDLAYLELSLEQLLNVPVTGSTLTDETLQTVPAAVSIFTREHIDRLGMDYLYELLNLVPGFQFDRNGSNGLAYTYSARGRRAAQQSLEVLLVIDGKVMNDPRAGSPDITLPLYPLSRIERLEVIRGPGSALYGSSAFTGVINIVTRREQKSLALAYGSLDRRSLEGFWNKSINDWQADVFVNAYKDTGDEYVVTDSFSGGPTTTTDPRQQFTADLALKRDKTRLDFSYNRAESRNFYVVDNIANEFNSNERELMHAYFEQGFEWLPDTHSHVTLSYQQFSYDFRLFLTGPDALQSVSQPSSAEPFWGDARQAGDSWRFSFANDWSINENSSTQWGIQWARHEETDASARGNFDLIQLNQQQFPITFYGDEGAVFPLGAEGSVTNTGAYVQYLRNLRDTTRLTLGGRYDDYPDFSGRFSPRLGVVEQLNKTYSLKLLYGEAFRAPTLAEVGLINNPLLLGNADLNHEIVKTWDLILMGNWQSTNFSVGVFENRYDQPIETVFIGSARTYRNSSGEKSQGVELEWTRDISDHWSVRSTYTYIDLPASAFREAARTASFEVNYAAEKWNWNLLGFYQDERETLITASTRQTLDDFWMLNTQWQYQFNSRYDLKLQLKNITDEDIATPAQGLARPEGIPNRGREFSAEVRWRF